MKNLLILLSLSILALVLPPWHASRVHASGAASLVVIVAAAAPVKDISAANLRRAFLGEGLATPDGKRFIPLNHPPGTPTRAAFDKAVLGLAADQVGAFWIDRKIRDQSPPPRTAPSPDLAARIAASLPGAITYVAPTMVNASVKVLTIDGKAPGQAGYLLQ
jgi:ABC-type phosphate transport system substrate-binding protein